MRGRWFQPAALLEIEIGPTAVPPPVSAVMTDSKIVEAVARAIYDAPNGIDGDQVADMLYEDERITGANAEECRAQTMAVCRSAARAAIEAYEAALMAAGMVIVPTAVPPLVAPR